MKLVPTFLLFLTSLIYSFCAFSQDEKSILPVDSFLEVNVKAANKGDVTTYEDLFGLDFYLQNKTIGIEQRSKKDNTSFKYKPNSDLAIGLGFSYRYVVLGGTINLFSIKSAEKLKTRSFDFQSQLASRRFLSIISAVFYKGFYADNPLLNVPSGGYYIRPDIGVSILGLDNMYAFNPKYSFRGSMLRFQRMKKSAGSALVSYNTSYMLKSADSSFVPKVLQNSFEDFDLRRIRIWNVALGAGYAYTWVINKQFLVSGIVNANVPLNFLKTQNESGQNDHQIKTGFDINMWLRASYERDIWALSVDYRNSKMVDASDEFNSTLGLNYGLARVIFSRRFGLKRETKKMLKPFDRLLDIPRNIFNKKKK